MGGRKGHQVFIVYGHGVEAHLCLHLLAKFNCVSSLEKLGQNHPSPTQQAQDRQVTGTEVLASLMVPTISIPQCPLGGPLWGVPLCTPSGKT